MEPEPQLPEKPRIPRWVWWLVMLGLIVWNIWLFRPQSQSEATIPYSAFLEQIRAGNVVSVQISGDEITGKFTEAIPWPQQTPGPQPTASGSANGTPTAVSSPQPTPTPAPRRKARASRFRRCRRIC